MIVHLLSWYIAENLFPVGQCEYNSFPMARKSIPKKQDWPQKGAHTHSTVQQRKKIQFQHPQFFSAVPKILVFFK